MPNVPKAAIGTCPIARSPSLISAMCSSALISLTLDLIALPPSPRSPSPTQTPPEAPMLSMAKPITNRHVRIAFFRFPLASLTNLTLHISHCVSIYPDDDQLILLSLLRTCVDMYSPLVSLVSVCHPPAIIFLSLQTRQDQANLQAR